MKLLRSLKLQLALGLFLVLAGVGLFILRDNNAFVRAVPVAPPSGVQAWVPPLPTTLSGAPVHLDIPSLKLSLPVINGYYNAHTGAWTLTNDSVQYATITPPPNNAGGNTFLYGHYRTGVFATLHTIKPGAQAVVTTDNGHTFTYTFVASRITDPLDDSIFTYKGAPILTIQTCSGLFFQYRQFFTFNLTSTH